MASSALEVYGKNRAFNQRILAQYQNKTTKLVWYEKFGKKYKLGSGVLTSGGDRKKFLCKTSFALSGEEMLELCNRLSKATRMPNTFNDFHLSECSDWAGNPTRLVLRDSDYNGLVLVRLKSVVADVEVIEAEDSDPDPDPTDDDLPTNSNDACAEWSECFEKFYFSRKDDWGNFKKILLSLHEDTQSLLAVDAESTLPILPTPPTMPISSVLAQKQIAGPSQQQSVTTKGGSSGGGKQAQKRKKPNSELISEVFEKATVVLSCFMSHYHVSAKQCVSLYRKQMTETCLFDYDKLVPLFDKECERLVFEIGKKISKYNRRTKDSIPLSWDNDDEK
jgi:hypothetical protein